MVFGLGRLLSAFILGVEGFEGFGVCVGLSGDKLYSKVLSLSGLGWADDGCSVSGMCKVVVVEFVEGV